MDGSGKDTQLGLLASAIRDDELEFGDKYSPMWITREPTKITKAGQEISQLLLSKELSKEKASELFIKDRIQHSKIIKEQLKHSIVLSSRYDVSTLTYQVAQGEDFEKLYKEHNYNSQEGALIPDITLIFDVPVEVSLQRINKRAGKQEVFENEVFLTKLYTIQNQIIDQLKSKGRNIILINANQSIEEVKEEMIEKLNTWYSKNHQ